MSDHAPPHHPRKANTAVRKGWAAVAVVAFHVAVLGMVGLMVVQGEDIPAARAIQVELERPVVPPPPVDLKPTLSRGGGAPKAPSVLHTPPPRPVREPEVIAPLVKAPEPALVIGGSDAQGPTSGFGQGGQGGGTGSGIGDGAGDGAGQGPRLIRGPTAAQLRAAHPPESFRRRQGGRVMLSCRIRLDTQLENCTVLSESPTGRGFGSAALSVASHFRFEPPVRAGQRIAGATVQVGVDWP